MNRRRRSPDGKHRLTSIVSKDVEEQLGCGFNDPRRICRTDEGRGFDDSRNPRWDEGKKRKKRKAPFDCIRCFRAVSPASRFQLFRVRIIFAFKYSVQ
jgi:hypothetical protein